MSESSIYLKAIDELNTKGWCQGSYYADGKCCLVGALRFASGAYTIASGNGFLIHSDSSEPFIIANLATDNLRKLVNCYATEYNDTHTKEEVIELLRKAHAHECAQATVTEP